MLKVGDIVGFKAGDIPYIPYRITDLEGDTFALLVLGVKGETEYANESVLTPLTLEDLVASYKELREYVEWLEERQRGDRDG